MSHFGVVASDVDKRADLRLVKRNYLFHSKVHAYLTLLELQTWHDSKNKIVIRMSETVSKYLST